MKINTNHLLSAVFDTYAPILDLSDILVIMFIFRRTYSFGKCAERIPVKHIQYGICDALGKPVTGGTGLKKTAIYTSLARLKHAGLVTEARGTNGVKMLSLDLSVGREAVVHSLQTFASSKSKKKKKAQLSLVVNRNVNIITPISFPL